jgi:hypothetical protein
MAKDLAAAAAPVIDQLLDADPDALFEQLGQRASALQDDYALGGEVQSESFEIQHLRIDVDFLALGRTVFDRWSPIAWRLVCGQEDHDKEGRQQFLDVFHANVDAKSVALALTSALAAMGVAPPLAPIIALLVVKFALEPTYEATCAAWKARLPQPAS